MPERRDYRKQLRRAILVMFFGLLAAMIAPDFGLGLKPYLSIAAVAAAAGGFLWMSTMPVGGLFRALMTSAGALAALYAVALGVASSPSGESNAWLVPAARGAGAAALFLSCAGMEILCRRLRWLPLSRAWILTQVAAALMYVLPAALGWFWPFYGRYIEAWRFVAALRYEFAGFDFHGMRVPGVVGGPKWLLLLRFAMLAPATMMLINLLRTYVWVAAPPPVDDTPAVPWSRR
jgi:hypothetical protein